MTVSTDGRKVILEGNGTKTDWDFTFPVFSADDLRVVITDTAGAETELVLDAAGGFTVTFDSALPSTGTVNYPWDVNGTTLVAGETITILRDMDFTQATDITNAGSYRAQTIENAFDKLTMLVLQLREQIDRVLIVPVSTPSDVSLELPAPEAGQTIGWNSNADGLVNLDPLDGASMFTALDSQNSVVDRFTATASQAVFTLTSAPGDENAIDVYIDGVHQNANSYALSGTPEVTLTLDTARSADEVVECRYRVLGTVYDTFTPAATSVTTSKLAADAVTYSKLDSTVRTRIESVTALTTHTTFENQTWSFTHSMAGSPAVKLIALKLLCTSIDQDYAVDDSIIVYPGVYLDGSNSRGFAVLNPSTTGFQIITALHGIAAPNKSTRVIAALDGSKWDIYPVVIG